LLVGGVSYRNMRQLEEASRLKEQTYRVLLTIEAAFAQIKDAQRASRSLAITGVERFLEPYHAALEAADERLKEVRDMTMDNLAQQQRLDALEPLLDQKRAGLEKEMDLRRTKGLQAAVQEMRTGEGKRLLDEIHDLLRAMQEEENDLLARRDSAVQAQTRI